MVQATRSQVGEAIRAIAHAMDVIKELGISCQGPVNQVGQAGRTRRNGAILIDWKGDQAFSTSGGSLGPVSQTYASLFTLSGRVRNLKNKTGLWVVRDLIYESLQGLIVPGYKDGLQMASFTPGPPDDGVYPFTCEFLAGAITISCISDDLLNLGGDPALADAFADAAARAQRIESFYFTGEISDFAGENTVAMPVVVEP